MDLEKRFKKYVLVAAEATKTHIEQNPLAIKTTNGFALDATINRKQLQAAFKSLTGMGIQEYQLIKRLQHARQLLEAGRISIKEVAIICRYKTPRSFTTAFKKKFGITPHEYRNQHVY